MAFWRTVGQAIFHTAAASGPSTSDRSSLRPERLADALGATAGAVTSGADVISFADGAGVDAGVEFDGDTELGS
jgi:hypothetical protein